jgi:transposase
MPMVGGLDVHRQQITFDYVDTDTGVVSRGRIAPADRKTFGAWLRARFSPGQQVHLAVEGCTGWRYVAEETRSAGYQVYLADPAEMSVRRGPKKRAKTDAADAQLARQLLWEDRLPVCWVPPAHILDLRALLEVYHELREQHTGWVQRIHAVLFHQGAVCLSGILDTRVGQDRLAAAVSELSPVGQVQVQTAQAMLGVLDEQLDGLRRRVRAAARSLYGARVLAEQLYGVGPMCAVALCCWLGGAGRFSSARKAVRFVGLDVTVYASAAKRSPGHLSKQGPPVLRWALYEAGKTHARGGAPDHGYYTQVKAVHTGKQASLSQARRIVRKAVHILDELGDQALVMR